MDRFYILNLGQPYDHIRARLREYINMYPYYDLGGYWSFWIGS
jgi:hypothetical protein